MRRRDPATVAVTVGGLGAAAVGVALRGGLAGGDLDVALLAVVMATAIVGELLPLPRVTGRPIPTSVAVIGTYALLGAPPWALVAAAVTGRAGAALLTGVPQGLAPRRLLRAASAGWLAAGAVGLGRAFVPWSIAPGVDVSVGAAAMLAVAMIVGLPIWDTFGTVGDTDARLQRLAVHLRKNWMVETAMASTAVLGAMVYPRLGVLVIPFLLLPLLAARSGLQGYRKVQQQHEQTLRAISRLPEELGETPADHAHRTAVLVAAVARRLGKSHDEQADLVQAAQLHELGRIRHEPGEDHSERSIALNGANILQQSGLAEAARIVGAHRDHVLGTGQSATVLRLACELDLALARTRDEGRAMAVVANGLTDPAEMRLLAAFDLETIRAV